LPGLLLAQSTSDNAQAGANFSLWFPLGLLCLVVLILAVIYTRPHQRVPPHPPAHARAGGGTGAQGVGTATGWGHDGPPPQQGGQAGPGQPGRPGGDDPGRIV
jgi:hypothetical protein